MRHPGIQRPAHRHVHVHVHVHIVHVQPAAVDHDDHPGAGGTVATAEWKQEHPQTALSAREGAAVAYDSDLVRKETILFGGFDRTGNPCVHGDTWAWDGSTWTLRYPAASPPARYGHTMAYDADHKQVVLFGGSDGGSDLADTWVWDGTTWTRRDTATGPSPRARQACDALRKQVVLFGGDHRGRVLGDTWVWDGSAWTERHPATNRPARGYAGTRRRVTAAGKSALVDAVLGFVPPEDRVRFPAMTSQSLFLHGPSAGRGAGGPPFVPLQRSGPATTSPPNAHLVPLGRP